MLRLCSIFSYGLKIFSTRISNKTITRTIHLCANVAHRAHSCSAGACAAGCCVRDQLQQNSVWMPVYSRRSILKVYRILKSCASGWGRSLNTLNVPTVRRPNKDAHISVHSRFVQINYRWSRILCIALNFYGR